MRAFVTAIAAFLLCASGSAQEFRISGPDKPIKPGECVFLHIEGVDLEAGQNALFHNSKRLKAGPPYMTPLTAHFEADEDGEYEVNAMVFWLETVGGVQMIRAQSLLLTIVVETPGPPPNPPKISVSDATVEEAAGYAIFDVGLDKPAIAPVTFRFATSDGTATAIRDYQPAQGELTIAKGESVARIDVPITDDDEGEGDETFTLTLSNVQNAIGDKLTATATIVDNDKPPVTELVGVVVTETQSEEENDYQWAQVMYGPTVKALMGAGKWVVVDDDIVGDVPDWVKACIKQSKDGGLKQPHLFLLDQDRSVVWHDQLPKSVDATVAIIKEWQP